MDEDHKHNSFPFCTKKLNEQNSILILTHEGYRITVLNHCKLNFLEYFIS